MEYVIVQNVLHVLKNWQMISLIYSQSQTENNESGNQWTWQIQR